MIERPASKQPIPSHAKKMFKGVVFEVYQWEQELFDGTTRTYEKVKRDDTVVIVPSLLDKRLVFLHDEQSGREPILTFPAGRMDLEGEQDPLLTAKRELLEETGYTSDEWSLWKAYQPATKIDWALYIFVAKHCRKVAEQSLEPSERIRVDLVSLDDVIALVHDPRFVSDDIKVELVEAKYDPAKRVLLEKRLFG